MTAAAGVLPASMAWLTSALDAAGKRYRLRGTTHLDGQCPAHDDREASMSADWRPADPPHRAGRVVVECHAGCDRDLIPAALGGTWRDLMDGPSEAGRSPTAAARQRLPSPASARSRAPRPRPAPADNPGMTDHAHTFDYRRPEARHAYTDASGEVLARVDRLRCTDPGCPNLAERGKAGHGFVTRRPDGRAVVGASAPLAGVLYRLPEVLAAVAEGRTVYLCEGEGDADALAAAGECATSAYGGAERPWHPGYTAALAGGHVVIVADRDAPNRRTGVRAGYKRAALAVAELADVAASVRVVQAAIDRPGADASDHLAAGLGVADLAPVPAEVYGSSSEHTPAAAAEPRAARARAAGGRESAPAALAASGNGGTPPPGPAAPPEADGPASPGPDPERPPRYPLPASAGAWAYSTGDDDDGRERGVYRQLGKEHGYVWQWVEWFPYVFERVAHRDGTGRRARMSYRLGTRLDAADDERTVAGHLAVKDGSWAEPLGVPLSADPKVIQAVASAIWREAERTAPLVEAAPRWTPAGVLEMPPADVGPAGYGVTLGTEAHAREVWTSADPDAEGIAPILGRHGRAALITGAGAAGPYLAPLRRQSFITHSAGRERRGKTTSHVVTAAVYGDPEVIVRPWDVSAIGLSQLAGEYGCLPPVLDELGARRGPKAEIQSIVFQLAQGARRTKGGREGTSKVGAPWHGVVLSTGNASLLACLTERGAMARVIEVETPVIGTVDAVDDPAAAADAERLEALAAEAYGWPWHWIRAGGVTPDRFGALVANAEADLVLPPGGTPRTIGRHLAAAVAGAALLDVALGTSCLRPAALAAAAELLAVMVERLAEMAAPPGERLAAAVAHAVISRPDAFPALGELRDPVAPRRYRDGEGFTITEGPDLGMAPPPSLVARWAAPPGLALGDVGVWVPALEKIRADTGLDDAVTALRELRDAGRLITGGESGQMRYRVRVNGQTGYAYVFRVADLTGDDGGQDDDGQDDDASHAHAHTRPIGDLAGTAGTDHLAALLPAETVSDAVPGQTGTDQLGRHSAAETAGRAETPAAGGAITAGPAETSPPAETGDPGVNAQATGSGDAVPAPVPAPVPAVEPYPLGAVLLADAGALYLGDGSDLAALDTLADVLELAAGLGLGAPRLHKAARDEPPGIYLTPAACERYGIPAEPDPDDASGRGLALPEDHPAAAALRAAGWKVGQIRTSFRVWRSGPERAALDVTLLGWIGHTDAVGLGALLADNPPPASLVRRLGRLAALAVAPTWSAGVTAERLMTALRPAERVRRDAQTGNWTRTPVAGSLRAPVRPSTYDAPDSHPVARDRPAALACRDESMNWTRPPDAWTGAERAAAYGVTVDVAAAFLAACSRLPLGLTGPREMTAAEAGAMTADPRRYLHPGGPAKQDAERGRFRAGVFVAEVSGLREQLDPRLPCPLTETGLWPDGPRPLHAPTLRYALEYPGVRVIVTAGAVHDDCGPYLDPWAARLVAAYLACLADAGITPGMAPAAFLDAYATAAGRAPEAWAVLAAVKALYKAGLGRMRQATGPWRAETRDPGVTCTDDRATWRPDVRAEVIARTRTDMHRKAVKVCALTGAAPLAWHHDALTYAAPDASALSVVPWTLDGQQVTGALRIGPRPGWVKFSHAEPMAEVLARVAEGDNPAIRRELDDDGGGQGDDARPGGGQ